MRLFLDGLPCAALTRRNYQADLSNFCGWLCRRGLLPENPVAGIEQPRVDATAPRLLTPEQAALVMRTAVEHRGGLYTLFFALALFAGLRPGEIERLIWQNVYLGDEPVIRVLLGKKRGRRAVRLIPILPNLKLWLEWGRAKGFPLCHQPLDNARKIRDVVDWQPDICRHSWISCRLALIKDEAQVAREAGNSPDVIFRHYFQLVAEAEARTYFEIKPPV